MVRLSQEGLTEVRAVRIPVVILNIIAYTGPETSRQLGRGVKVGALHRWGRQSSSDDNGALGDCDPDPSSSDGGY
jgi:hypothetical protein